MSEDVASPKADVSFLVLLVVTVWFWVWVWVRVRLGWIMWECESMGSWV